MEQILGEGWTCYTVPDVYKRAGEVIEVTNDNKHIHFFDFSKQSKHGRSAIGSLRYSFDFYTTALTQILSRFGLLKRDDNIEARVSRKITTSVSYGDTQKFVIDADGLEYITSQVGKKDLNPLSHYLVFRESHAAKTISVHLNSEDTQSLGLNIRIADDIGPGLTIKRAGEEEYRLEETFNEHVGFCTIATELVIKTNFHGSPTVELGNDIRLSHDMVIQGRKP